MTASAFMGVLHNTPNQKSACFVLYLKIINSVDYFEFWKFWIFKKSWFNTF